MKKNRYIFIFLLLVVLLAILLVVTYLNAKQQARLTHQRHLLCETLKPGMSEDEVLNILHQAGDFTVGRSEGTGGDITLGINFIDQKGQTLYGGFSLWFKNNKYLGAYINAFDNSKVICFFTQADITQPTNIVDETPIPMP